MALTFRQLQAKHPKLDALIKAMDAAINRALALPPPVIGTNRYVIWGQLCRPGDSSRKDFKRVNESVVGIIAYINIGTYENPGKICPTTELTVVLKPTPALPKSGETFERLLKIQSSVEEWCAHEILNNPEWTTLGQMYQGCDMKTIIERMRLNRDTQGVNSSFQSRLRMKDGEPQLTLAHKLFRKSDLSLAACQEQCRNMLHVIADPDTSLYGEVSELVENMSANDPFTISAPPFFTAQGVQIKVSEVLELQGAPITTKFSMRLVTHTDKSKPNDPDPPKGCHIRIYPSEVIVYSCHPPGSVAGQAHAAVIDQETANDLYGDDEGDGDAGHGDESPDHDNGDDAAFMAAAEQTDDLIAASQACQNHPKRKVESDDEDDDDDDEHTVKRVRDE